MCLLTVIPCIYWLNLNLLQSTLAIHWKMEMCAVIWWKYSGNYSSTLQAFIVVNENLELLHPSWRKYATGSQQLAVLHLCRRGSTQSHLTQLLFAMEEPKDQLVTILIPKLKCIQYPYPNIVTFGWSFTGFPVYYIGFHSVSIRITCVLV